MSTLNQRAEDTVIAAMLAGFWAGIMMSKLDALTVKLNLPVLHAVAQWWPLLLIAAGVTLLMRHQKRAVPVREANGLLHFPQRDTKQQNNQQIGEHVNAR